MTPTADRRCRRRRRADAGLHEISPHLDHALCQLRPKDRTAVALRFLENRSMADVGHALGLSPNAAQKVIARALDKLRRMLGSRGVMFSSTAALSAAMLESAAPRCAGEHARPGRRRCAGRRERRLSRRAAAATASHLLADAADSRGDRGGEDCG